VHQLITHTIPPTGYADGLKCADEARAELERYLDSLTDNRSITTSDHVSDKENNSGSVKQAKTRRGRKRKIEVSQESDTMVVSSEEIGDGNEVSHGKKTSERTNKNGQTKEGKGQRQMKRKKVDLSVGKVDDLSEVEAAEIMSESFEDLDTVMNEGSENTSPNMSSSFKSGKYTVILYLICIICSYFNVTSPGH